AHSTAKIRRQPIDSGELIYAYAGSMDARAFLAAADIRDACSRRRFSRRGFDTAIGYVEGANASSDGDDHQRRGQQCGTQTIRGNRELTQCGFAFNSDLYGLRTANQRKIGR